MKLLASVLSLSLVGLTTQQTSNYCDPLLCPGGRTHVACNAPIAMGSSCGPQGQEVPLDPTYQALIVDQHNQLRNTVAQGRQEYAAGSFYPQAARMGTMQWDAELASVAAYNARQCVLSNDQCRNTGRFPFAGQNIGIEKYYGQSVDKSALITGMINRWFSQASNANPNFIASYPRGYSGPQIGLFTQLVSDRSTRVGCSLVSWVDTAGWTNQYFVCNYALANVIDRPIYVAGPACSQCTTGCNAAYPGLCSPAEEISSSVFA